MAESNEQKFNFRESNLKIDDLTNNSGVDLSKIDLKDYPDLSGQISGYTATSGSLEDEITQPWETLSSICETLDPAVKAVKTAIEPIKDLWEDLFELPLSIIGATLGATGMKEK